MENATISNNQEDITGLGSYTALGIKSFWEYYTNPVIVRTVMGINSSGDGIFWTTD